LTTPVLALERLFVDVQTRFASEAGLIGLPETAYFTGTASIAGSPTAAAEVKILFTVGGTVGVAGIVYRVSTDDGATYGAPIALGLATAIVVFGVTLTLAGAVTALDYVRWTQNGPAVPVFQFGTREPAKRGDVYRVVFVPGDASGNAGEVVAPRNPGRNPRPLATLVELFTIYCEAFDSSAGSPEVELRQWKAARLLWDAVIRAIYLSAHGTYEVISTEHMVERATRRHAWSMRSVLAIQAMVPDAPAFVVTPPQVALTVGLEVDDDPVEIITPP
jgi:hypothetical protein